MTNFGLADTLSPFHVSRSLYFHCLSGVTTKVLVRMQGSIEACQKGLIKAIVKFAYRVKSGMKYPVCATHSKVLDKCY